MIEDVKTIVDLFNELPEDERGFMQHQPSVGGMCSKEAIRRGANIVDNSSARPSRYEGV